MSSISTVKAALKATLSGVAGLSTIYATAPATLNNAALPALVVFAGPGTYQRTGYQEPTTEERRIYTLDLYVKPVQAGVYGEAEMAVEQFFERIAAALGAAPRLGSDVALLATLTKDSGVNLMPYAGGEYLGTEFTVEVELL